MGGRQRRAKRLAKAKAVRSGIVKANLANPPEVSKQVIRSKGGSLSTMTGNTSSLDRARLMGATHTGVRTPLHEPGTRKNGQSVLVMRKGKAGEYFERDVIAVRGYSLGRPEPAPFGKVPPPKVERPTGPKDKVNSKLNAYQKARREESRELKRAAAVAEAWRLAMARKKAK
jgi:hypothetical protein